MNTYRRLYCLALAGILVLASCSKPGNGNRTPDGGFILRAGVEDTKTEIGEQSGGSYPMRWSEGDAISVNGVASVALTTEEAGDSQASFTFESTPVEASVYNILYPASTQDNKLFLDGKRIPLYGHIGSLDDIATMRSPATVVLFTLKGSALITHMEVSAVEGEKIYGQFTVGKDDAGALDGSLTPTEGAAPYMDITFGSGLSLSSEGVKVFFPVPPGNYSKGLKAVLHDNGGSSMTLRMFMSGATLQASHAAAFTPVNYVGGSEVVFSSTDSYEKIDGVEFEENAGADSMQATGGSTTVSIKAGTYNIWAPSARKSVIENPDTYPGVSEQRSWANSYLAVAEMIEWLDCDIMGLQEVTNMVYKTANTWTKGKDYDGNYHFLNDQLAGYGWVIYNAANTEYDSWFPDNTTGGGLGSTDAIIYKKSVLTLVSHGRCWLGGSRTLAPQDYSGDGYGTNRPAHWAKFTHKASGKQFYFITTHLDLPNAGGPGDDKEYAQRRNATELIEWFAPTYTDESLPSIICGDMNCDSGAANYNILISGRWKDCRDIMKADGTLDFTELRYPGTMNSDKAETAIGTWRPDHILIHGCTVSYYKVAREKFQTADGTEHWPSDHFPIKTIINF